MAPTALALPNNGKPSEKVQPAGTTKPIKRSDFPPHFFWGAATSAFQTEGRDGRGVHTWDTFLPSEKAVNSYKLYQEDIKCLKEMGVNSYRFSIAWSRILPKGSKSGGINQEGIDFYNKLINELIQNGITPFVTLFHFDLPIELQNKYHGFLDKQIVDDFRDYCEICFDAFGDRVKHWSTLNEPNLYGKEGFSILSQKGYEAQHCFVAMHNLILCHAAAFNLYKQKNKHDGEIGVVLHLEWYEPYSHKRCDLHARERALDFNFGWFLEPLLHGDYPLIVRALGGSAVPAFTDEEKEMVKCSFDFLGVNYYTARYAKHVPLTANHKYYRADDYRHVDTLVHKNEKPLGPDTPTLLVVYPEGLKSVLRYLRREYNIHRVYITENGCSEVRKENEIILDDKARIKFIRDHLSIIEEANREGMDVRGYFVWSLMDNVEMTHGYNHGFGLHYTDHNNDFQRIPKRSAKCYKSFMAGNEWGKLSEGEA